MKPTDPPAKAFDSEDATPRDGASGQFLKGYQGGSRAGRPRGSRAKLGEKFFAALVADFDEHGEAAIARVRFLRPDVYMQVVARLMPQKIEISTPTDGMTDEQLEQMLAFASAKIAEAGGVIEGSMRNVTPVLPPPLADAPPTSAQIAAEAQRRDLHDQHDALRAAEPVAPVPAAGPHPVGRSTPEPVRTIERRNIAKLDNRDDVDPASLF